MMLSDEEKQAIIDKYHTDKNFDMWDAFDAVERAVLAKASQQVHGKNVAHEIKITVESLIESARCMGALSQDKDAHAYWINKTEEHRKKVYAIIESSKATPAPKQEPVAHAEYQGCLSGVHVRMLASAPKEFTGYLYAHPAPPQAAAIPEGWKLVPIEPTGVMKDAGNNNVPLSVKYLHPAAEVYRAMLSAAPKPSDKQ